MRPVSPPPEDSRGPPDLLPGGRGPRQALLAPRRAHRRGPLPGLRSGPADRPPLPGGPGRVRVHGQPAAGPRRDQHDRLRRRGRLGHDLRPDRAQLPHRRVRRGHLPAGGHHRQEPDDDDVIREIGDLSHGTDTRCPSRTQRVDFHGASTYIGQSTRQCSATTADL